MIKSFDLKTKSIAIFLTISLSVSQTISYAYPSDLIKTTSSPQNLLSSLHLSSNWATIEEFKQGSSDKTIILIQDAHDSLEAQLKIAKMIDCLVARGRIGLVVEEGYEGAIPTDAFFSSLRDKEQRRKVAFFFLDKLRIGGADYAHINRKKDFKLIGVDDLNLHAQNVLAYRRASRNRIEIEEDLKGIRGELEIAAQRVFPREIKSWLTLKKKLDQGQLSMLDYLKRILGVRFAPESSKAGFLRDYLLERVKDPSAPFPVITLLLAAEATRRADLIAQAKNIDPQLFFADIDSLENELAAMYLRSDQQREIFHTIKILSLIDRLSKMELGFEEFRKVRSELSRFNSEKLADLLLRITGAPVVLSKAWEDLISESVAFYEIAIRRDASVEKKASVGIAPS